MKIFLHLANKKKYIHIILKIHSVVIKINIKGRVKIGETKKYGCVFTRMSDGGVHFLF